MKLLAWNLNHRAARRRIPDWVAMAIVSHSPDVVVVTEYVEGPDHGRFLTALAEGGLKHSLVSPRTAKQNQVLIASNHALSRGMLRAPAIHPAVPPNAIETILEPSGLHVVGFRMPVFKPAERALKRETWNWLLAELDQRRGRPAVIAGDFNSAPGDSRALCGDCFAALSQSGWQYGTPTAGCSWRHVKSGSERQIFCRPRWCSGSPNTSGNSRTYRPKPRLKSWRSRSRYAHWRFSGERELTASGKWAVTSNQQHADWLINQSREKTL